MELKNSWLIRVLAFLVGVGAVHAEDQAQTLHWIRVHGFLMWASMGFLMPLAIILVRFTKHARESGSKERVKTLYYLHLFIQIAAVLGSIAGALVGFLRWDNTFPYTHERLGLALYIVVWLAPIVGFIRPTHGDRSRIVWYALHWLLGTGGVILGFINIFIGMHVYELISSKSIRTFNILFSIQLSLMGFAYLTQDRWNYFLGPRESEQAGGTNLCCSSPESF